MYLLKMLPMLESGLDLNENDVGRLISAAVKESGRSVYVCVTAVGCGLSCGLFGRYLYQVFSDDHYERVPKELVDTLLCKPSPNTINA